ncbi:MAG: glycine zipper 2TM domain-containing protein [Gemmatimonadota bacterium]
MTKRRMGAAWLLMLPLAMVPAACAGDGAADRSALRQDELDRELDLALRSDTTPVAFMDTVVNADEKTPTPEPGPSPRVEQPRAPRPDPAPAPQPVRPRTPRTEMPAPAPAPRPRLASVSRGTSMALTMNQTLSTETNRVGDSFTATLQSSITDASGTVLIPAGATVRGRMTQVDKSGHVGETGIIKLAFESVSFGGSSYPLDATVMRAHPERSNRTSTREQVTKVAAGAAAGAVLGRVLGKNTRSTVKGAVIGAAAGTAIAMGTADVDVVLPAGSELVIRLDSPIQVRRQAAQ